MSAYGKHPKNREGSAVALVTDSPRRAAGVQRRPGCEPRAGIRIADARLYPYVPLVLVGARVVFEGTAVMTADAAASHARLLAETVAEHGDPRDFGEGR
jgi:hypothetical protein